MGHYKSSTALLMCHSADDLQGQFMGRIRFNSGLLIGFWGHSRHLAEDFGEMRLVGKAAL